MVHSGGAVVIGRGRLHLWGQGRGGYGNCIFAQFCCEPKLLFKTKRNKKPFTNLSAHSVLIPMSLGSRFFFRPPRFQHPTSDPCRTPALQPNQSPLPEVHAQSHLRPPPEHQVDPVGRSEFCSLGKGPPHTVLSAAEGAGGAAASRLGLGPGCGADPFVGQTWTFFPSLLPQVV